MSFTQLRSAVAVSVGLLLLVACSGGGTAEPTATPTPDFRTATSDDGRLTLEIPLDAVAEDVEISITAVLLEELPEPLRTVRGAGTGYRLEPDGLEFSEPVTAVLELDRSELDPEEDGSVTAYALVSQGADGELELLENLETLANLGEDTIIARGELSHFSWLSRTKGSLNVQLDVVPREQPVGGSFSALGRVGNSDTSGNVTVEDVEGTFRAFGTVSSTGTTTFSATGLLGNSTWTTATGSFQCGDDPGIGSYSLQGEGTSVRVLPDGRELRTDLRVVLDSVVECVAPDAATATDVTPTVDLTPEPTDTPAATATPPPEEATATPERTPTPPGFSGAALSISCEHTNPGISSELIVRVSGLEPGQFIGGQASGDGLIDGPVTIFGEADSEGKVEIRITIFQFGEHEVVFDSAGLSGSYTVGKNCPG